MLQEQTEDFIKGYKACKKDFESFIHESMVRNGGVTNGSQAIHVLDDLALYLHTLNVHIIQMEEQIIH